MDVVAHADFSVVGLDDESMSFLEALGHWRMTGATGWRYLPVAPGDAASLPGPGAFSQRAIEAGAALVACDGPAVGLLPATSGSGTPWQTCRVAGRGTSLSESPAEAERRLLVVVTEASDELERLDVADSGTVAEDLLGRWEAVDPVPPGWDRRAERLVARSTRMLELVSLAARDVGGSRTAAEAGSRASHLRELGRVARFAHSVAWNDGVRRAATARRER